MRFGGRLTCLVFAILGLSVITAPIVKAAVDGLLAIAPQTSGFFRLNAVQGAYDFGRIYRRLLLALTLVLGYFGKAWLGPISLHGIGAGSRRGYHFGSGLLLGCCSFAVFLTVCILLDNRSPAPAAPANWLLRVGGALASGFLVGAIEETIFRGCLLGGFLLDHTKFVAALVSSSLFSAVHFLRASVPVTPGLDVDVGLQALLAHVHPLVQPASLFPFIGLLLVGMILAYAYLWTRSLPFAVGLHAGWVFLGKIGGDLFRVPIGVEWLYGQQGVLAGALGWLVLVLMFPVLRLWIHVASSAGRPHQP